MNQTTWIVSEIKHITTTFTKRVAGSDSLRASQEYMRGLVSGWADHVEMQDFSLSPHAFIGSIPLQAALGLAGAICFLLSGLVYGLLWVSLVFFVITFLSMIFEYILYYPAFDFLYPKSKGLNLYAERKASGESRKKIILCAHADAAFEMPMFQWRNPPLFYGLIFLAYGSVIAIPVLIIIFLCHPGTVPPLWLRIVMMVLSCSFLPFLGFARWSEIVPGANDNMTGSLIALSILKEMEENNERFADTDVGCLITDGEESGLRGAMAFAKKYRDELRDPNTVVIAIDTIRDEDQLMVYQRGINWTQANDENVCRLLQEAAKRCGRDLPYTTAYPGATDAEAFSRMKIKAAAICAIDHVPEDYYHSRHDTWDNMRPECIRVTRMIVKEAVRLFAEGDA